MDAPMPLEVKEAWARFVKVDAEWPPWMDIYPAIFEDGWLFPLQRSRETQAMIAMARRIRPKVVMEIGADKGGGFYHWVKAFVPMLEAAIAIEIRGCPYREAFAEMFPELPILYLEESSYAFSTAYEVSKFLDGRKIDVLFIDGDKDKTREDFELYLPQMRIGGGLVMIHDVRDDINPKRVFTQLSKAYRSEIIYYPHEGIEAASRAAAGMPVKNSYDDWLRTWRDTSCAVGVIHV